MSPQKRFWIDQVGFFSVCALFAIVPANFSGYYLLDTAQLATHCNAIAGAIWYVMSGWLFGFSSIVLILVGAVLVPGELLGHPRPYKRGSSNAIEFKQIWRRNLLVAVGVLAWLIIISSAVIFRLIAG